MERRGGEVGRAKTSKLDKALVNSEFLTIEQFQKQIIPWSFDTIKRRIENEGLPAIKDTNGYVFKRTAIVEWFKRREVMAG